MDSVISFVVRIKFAAILITIFVENCCKNRHCLYKSKLGLNYLRSDGTTVANAGISYRLFMKHGRWKSETVVWEKKSKNSTSSIHEFMN